MNMVSTPIVSIIVPVYKAESYLHRCVDSILAQTLLDFELLLIDDGSPDKSGDICDMYAQKDSRVRVFHKNNGGVSSARQCGLDNVQGEYIIHADPDDWVEPDMLEELYRKAVEDNADMVICDMFVNYPNKQVYQTQSPSEHNHETVLKELFLQLHGSCCNKLVRRGCCERYGLKFDMELSFCEDLYFNSSLLKHPIKVSYLPKAFYHYDQVINDNSIVKSYSNAVYEKDRMLYDKFCDLLKDTPAYTYAETYMGYLLVVRAFRGNIFTSREFYDRCNGFVACIRNKCQYNKNLLYYALLLSCKGCYRVIYTFYNLLKS